MTSSKTFGNYLMYICAAILLIFSISFVYNYANITDLLKEDIKINGWIVVLWLVLVGLFIFSLLILKKLKEICNWKIILSYFSETIVIIYTAIMGILFFNPNLKILFKIALLITSFILFYVAIKMRK